MQLDFVGAGFEFADPFALDYLQRRRVLCSLAECVNERFLRNVVTEDAHPDFARPEKDFGCADQVSGIVNQADCIEFGGLLFAVFPSAEVLQQGDCRVEEGRRSGVRAIAGGPVRCSYQSDGDMALRQCECRA